MMCPPSFSGGRRAGRARRAFALVIVLIILSVLALVAVGYLSSMSQERATANAFGNKARAEQSAQAGVDTAMGILKDYFKAFPDSATVWEPLSKNTDGTTNDGTALYLHAVPDANNLPNPAPNPGDATANSTTGNGPNNVKAENGSNPGADNRSVFILPLTSGATPALAANRALPTINTSSPNTFVDLNAHRYLADDQGWLGTPPNYPYTTPRLPRPVRVPWVEVQQQGPVAGGGTPPVVARYAFWVEDESFRANVSYASQTSLTNRRDNSANAALNSTDLNLVNTLTTIGDAAPSTTAPSLITARNGYPGAVFPESSAFAHAAGLASATANGLRFLTTVNSSALNLSRHGTQRLNLNSVVLQSAPATAAQSQIDQIVATIQFHAPNFSQRFYRTAIPTASPPPNPNPLNLFTVPQDPAASSATQPYRLIYTYKVAANIRDYIDPDPAPTIINAKGYVPPGSSAAGDPGGTVRTGRQTLAFTAVSGLSDGPNEVWAQGKDAAPFIEECGTRFRGGPGRDSSNNPTGNSSRYSLAIDYYVEVWNMSNLDVPATSLGPHPVLRIANPTKWVAMPGGGDLTCDDPAPANGMLSGTRNVKPAQRDYDIDISSVTFKAGVATVITTDPNWTDTALRDTAGGQPFSSEGSNHVYLCSTFYNAPGAPYAGKRVFNGPMPAGATSIQMLDGGDTSSSGYTTSSDYETDVILTTDDGAVDCIEGGLPIYNNNAAISLTAGGGSAIANTLFGGRLHGNNYTTYPAVTGDPRGNNEQLEYLVYKSGGGPDQTRYYNPTASIPMNFGVPNQNYVQPAGASPSSPWTDYYTFPRRLTS